jgi:hypothetical protein
MLRSAASTLGLAAALLSVPLAAAAQDAAMSDSDYMTKVAAAAPPAVVKGATIVEMQKDGTMRTLQTGSNGFTCMLADPYDAMCLDANALLWAQALMKHGAPPDGIGFVYMLAGDNGASNTDPYATTSTSDNHWVKTGPHVMIVGSAAKSLGYPTTSDPDPTKPYVMWPDTPYAHVMIPVATPPQ